LSFDAWKYLQEQLILPNLIKKSTLYISGTFPAISPPARPCKECWGLIIPFSFQQDTLLAKRDQPLQRDRYS
jgi:hypothetical protein